MQITKHNINEVIENYLKEVKVRYVILDPDSKGCCYEIFVSSLSGYIQLEYNLDSDDYTYVAIQFFTDVDVSGNSIYHSDWDNEPEQLSSVEEEIEELLNAVKRVSQGISKIYAKIEQIKDICEEYQLHFEDFISLNYDFDN